MTEEEKKEVRKVYQRRWMAKKRKALKESRGVEEVKLALPRALVADLRARVPKGASLRQWLVVFLRESLKVSCVNAGAENAATVTVMPPPIPTVHLSGAARNARCPCGSGRKTKACCGKAG